MTLHTLSLRNLSLRNISITAITTIAGFALLTGVAATPASAQFLGIRLFSTPSGWYDHDGHYHRYDDNRDRYREVERCAPINPADRSGRHFQAYQSDCAAPSYRTNRDGWYDRDGHYHRYSDDHNRDSRSRRRDRDRWYDRNSNFFPFNYRR